MRNLLGKICILLLASLVLVGCKTHKKVNDTGFVEDSIYYNPGKEKKRHVGDILDHKSRKALVESACEWIGTPYKYAWQIKGQGTDCSGMVMVVYEEVTGKKIPRNSAKQAEYCTPLSQDDVKAGDLVFFATGKDPDRVSHVGMMINEREFVHASSSKGVVISSMESRYYTQHFIMYGRVP